MLAVLLWEHSLDRVFHDETDMPHQKCIYSGRCNIHIHKRAELKFSTTIYQLVCSVSQVTFLAPRVRKSKEREGEVDRSANSYRKKVAEKRRNSAKSFNQWVFK